MGHKLRLWLIRRIGTNEFMIQSPLGYSETIDSNASVAIYTHKHHAVAKMRKHKGYEVVAFDTTMTEIKS